MTATDESFARDVRNFAGLTLDTSRAVRTFVDIAPRLRTIAAVLDWLDKLARPFGCRLIGIWELPPDFAQQLGLWQPGVNLFIHHDVPRTFWPHYAAEYRKHGYSFMSLKARQTSEPFTFSEAEDEAKARRQRNMWVFGFFRSYGYNDGLYCTSRRWAVVFVSERLLVLSPTDRLFLHAAAIRAFGRIEKIIMGRPRLRSQRKNGVRLTPREIEVLQATAIHGDAAAAGNALGISAETIETHLKHARRKFKVKHTAQALLSALKARLIEY